MKLKYFDISEFDSPDEKGSGANMNIDFLQKLDAIRDGVGPLKINSGYRTKAHNQKVKGSPNSSHLKGLAVDIHCTDSRKRWQIVAAAMAEGINRIGIAKTFVHLDVDKDKPPHVIWTY